MALNVVALFVFIFGAYAYGYLALLWLRERTAIWSHVTAPPELHAQIGRVSFAMFAVCGIWFVLHAIIAFRALMGQPLTNDLVRLGTLELVFIFPGLIFHNYLLEATSVSKAFDRVGPWRAVMWLLYAAGVGLALYFTAVVFRLIPAPPDVDAYINLSISLLFTAMSIASLIVISTREKPPTTDDGRRLRVAIRVLFVGMIAIFVALNVLPRNFLLDVLNVAVRATPLLFLVVSVYFGNRIQFYDLVIKRAVLLMVSLVLSGVMLALTVGWIDDMPQGAARPWLYAVVLLPLALTIPWLHGQVERLLDRWWFGRHFAPVDAVMHVLGAMQEAATEQTLVTAAERTLGDMFQRRILVLLDEQPLPTDATVVAQLRTPFSDGTIRLALLNDAREAVLLSEDLALLRSLGGVLGYMLDNVRLQRKRVEQEQLAQQLRLQSSRSELKALRAQINPHFLFNALNAIASLIHTDPARADAAVEQLAEVFRYTLRRSEQEWAPLDQELAFARAYLDVEHARFGKRLEYTIRADPSAQRAHVPSMLLQTLVENAVKHGISRLRGPGRIDVTAGVDNGRLLLEVRDTGPGPQLERTQTKPQGESFGLRSVRDRLQGHFGADASLQLTREDDTTVARITLPLIADGSPVAAR